MRLLGRHGFKIKAALLASMAFVAMSSMPASAVTATVAAGVANLPEFPCSSNPCSGGTFSGNLAGKGSGGIGFGANGTITSTYTYTEQCNVGDVVPQSGTANGHFSIQSSKTNVEADFSWVRTGLVANITLTNVVINGDTSSPGSGSSTGVFEPAGKGRCGKPTPIIAVVELVATF
jgi:hypothetical protein